MPRFFKKNEVDFPEYLDEEQKQNGKKNLRTFNALNGISVAFLLNDLLILYGIRVGLSDPQLALIASFMYLTMPFMLLGKFLIPRIGVSRTWSLAWFLRYVCALLMAGAPFVPALGRGDVLEVETIVPLFVLIGAFGFALFRSVGVVADSPLTGDITSYDERGGFISGNWLRSQISYFFSLVLVLVLIRLFNQIWVYQLVITIGCAIGFYASSRLLKIPETDKPGKSARLPMIYTLRKIRKNQKLGRLIGGWTAGDSAFVLVIPFSLITVKNGYGISDFQALILSMIIIVGNIVSSVVNGRIADKVGPRPLLIIYVSVFFAAAVYWAVAPALFIMPVVAVMFFIAGFSKTGIRLAAHHYFLQTTNAEERVGLSLSARMASGTIAGLAAALGGGTAFTLIRAAGFEGLGVYRVYFRVALPVLLLFIFLSVKTEKLSGEWKMSEVMKLVRFVKSDKDKK